jgi:hypothetical protein
VAAVSGEAAEALRRFVSGEPEAEPLRIDAVRLDWRRPQDPPRAELARLLGALDRDPDERLSVNVLVPPFTSTLSTVADAAGLVDPNRDCWYSTGVLRPDLAAGRGYARDVIGVRELFADLDVKAGGVPSYDAATAVIADLSTMLGVDPVAIVASGHGLQPHWAIERGDDTDWPSSEDAGWRTAQTLFRRWGRLVAHVAERHGGATDSVFDLSRVLRVPGTTNCKSPAEPRPVTAGYFGGAPVSLARLGEVLDEYGVPKMTEDGEQLGEQVSAPLSWAFADATCGYVAGMVAGWATDTPAARHPWLVGQAVRLAAAHRLGCITETDHAAARRALAARFRGLLKANPAREETPGEVAAAFAWGIARCAGFTDERALAELGKHPHEPRDWADIFDLLGEEAGEEEFWTSRPILEHVRLFARARMCSPWAVLGVLLARVVASVPPFVVLPPLVGSAASLNLFVALVGASGGGKGAAESCAADAVLLSPSPDVATVGSGEGIAHLYAHREKGEVVRDREAVLFTVPEVDNLTALGQRQGSTLLPQLRMAWMGERLGFSYADPAKRLPIPRHTYRMGLVLGVQPGRAGPLLDDADGGTPQRFVWLPATDPGAPDTPPACPTPRRWTLPAPWKAGEGGLAALAIPDAATQAIIANRRATLRGTGDPLDGHALLARLKLAAALALLDQRQQVTDEDWTLAGAVMAMSGGTRASVVEHLKQEAKTNTARGEAAAARAITVEDRTAAHATARVGRRVVERLKAYGDWMTGAELRRATTSRDRQWLDEALDLLTRSGQVEVEKMPGQGQPGLQYGMAK